MKKLQRNYFIKFTRGIRNGVTLAAEEEIGIGYPYTLMLETDLGFHSSNKGIFQIYNLPRDLHAKLWKDKTNESVFIKMEVYAGYNDNMPLIFSGFVVQGDTERTSGSTEFVTTIQAEEGQQEYSNLFVNYTFMKDTEFRDIVNTFLSESNGVYTGYISPTIPKLKRARTFIGQPMYLLRQEYAGMNIFIEKGRLNVLNENEVIPADIPVITADSGLLGSPRNMDGTIILETIFEPGLKSGQAIQVLSDSLPFMNQFYRIEAIKHKGTISGSVSGKLTTSLTLTMLGENFELLKYEVPYDYSGEVGEWQKPVIGRVTSPFMKNRLNPITGKMQNHDGMDIGADYNTPVHASASGKVIFCGQKGGYGNAILIDNGLVNGKNVSTLYGHLNSFSVNNGQVINAGQNIGLVGSTGQSTGPHLHFEIRENGVPVNPTKYIGNY